MLCYFFSYSLASDFNSASKSVEKIKVVCLLDFYFFFLLTAFATVLPEECFSVLEEFVSIDSREFVLLDSINTNMVPIGKMHVVSKIERMLFEYSLRILKVQLIFSTCKLEALSNTRYLTLPIRLMCV